MANPRTRVCDVAVSVMIETGNPSVMYGDEWLCHQIAKRMGWEPDGPWTTRRVLAALARTPGKLIAGKVRMPSDQWRAGSKGHSDGVVLIWQGTVYGWKNCLRDAAHEQPGAYAVDESGHVFIAKGGNEYDGAKAWVAVATN